MVCDLQSRESLDKAVDGPKTGFTSLEPDFPFHR